MKVNYTLPGMLPEAARTPAAEAGEHGLEAFGTQLQRLRTPEFTDWRTLLRLDAPLAGLAGIGPPPVPRGVGWREGASGRSWWRGMLRKHAALLESSDPDTDDEPPVQRMLAYLQESQQREDEIFARQMAEEKD
jgi:hypothetical protein